MKVNEDYFKKCVFKLLILRIIPELTSGFRTHFGLSFRAFLKLSSLLGSCELGKTLLNFDLYIFFSAEIVDDCIFKF